MAHVAKYSSGATGNMMHHYRRDREATLERVNIDRERTHLNYALGPDRGVEYIRQRMLEVEATMDRSIRKDAVTLCDWVVTVPPDVREEDYRKFFETTYDFVERRYGADNMLGGWVHMDETTPHIHIAFTPVVEREDGRLAFSAKTMINKGDLDSFHNQLSRTLERSLGYSCQILLEQTQEKSLERSLSRVGSMKEYQQAKDGLERLRRRERESGERNRELEREVGGLRLAVGEREREVGQAQSRERQIERAYQAREKEIEGLAQEIRQERERTRGIDQAIERARGKIAELQQLIDRALDRAAEKIRARSRSLAARLGLDSRSSGLDAQQFDKDAVQRCIKAFREADHMRWEIPQMERIIRERRREHEEAQYDLKRAEERFESSKSTMEGYYSQQGKLEQDYGKWSQHRLRFRKELATYEERKASIQREIDLYIGGYRSSESKLEYMRGKEKKASENLEHAIRRERELPSQVEKRSAEAKEMLAALSLDEQLSVDAEMFKYVEREREKFIESSRRVQSEIERDGYTVRRLRTIDEVSVDMTKYRDYTTAVRELGLEGQMERRRDGAREAYIERKEMLEHARELEETKDLDRKIELSAEVIRNLSRTDEFKRELDRELAGAGGGISRELTVESIARDLEAGRTEPYEKAIGGMDINGIDSERMLLADLALTAMQEIDEEKTRDASRKLSLDERIDRTVELILDMTRDWVVSMELVQGLDRTRDYRKNPLTRDEIKHDLSEGLAEEYEKAIKHVTEKLELNRPQRLVMREIAVDLARVGREVKERDWRREIARERSVNEAWRNLERSCSMGSQSQGLSR